MQSLLLSDLRLGLRDLLDNKAAALTATRSGQLYAPLLADQRTAIDALPDPTSTARPLADELAQTDADHDGFALAIWHYTEALRLHPGLAADVREAAAQVRETFLPVRSIVNRSYASEAAHALGKRARLPDHAAAFALLTVPSGETLEAWVEGFITRGEALETLLQARAAASGEPTRSEAGKLRVETLGLLGRLRSALADELARTPDVLATTDATLFGYFDQLTEARNTGTRNTGSDDETPPAAEATPAEPPPET